MQELGKSLILFGIILALAGVLLIFFNKISLVGKLPGDFLFQRKNLTFYFPLATCIAASAVISLVLWLLARK